MAATIKIVIESSAAGGGLAETRKELDGLDRAARTSGDGFTILKGVAVNAISAIASAVASATGAVAGFVKDSVSVAGDFEAGINGLAAVTGTALADAGFSFDDVREKALKMGAETQYSSAQALAAMTELAKGGVAIEDVMNGATDATLGLAAAGGVELPAAAGIIAKTLGVWARSGVEAIDVTNLLSAAANASTVDVQELADGMANAAGRAQAMNLDYKDFVTTMALIAPNFSSAQEAGSSFNNFLARLQPTTKAQIAAFEELGWITEEGTSIFFDSTGAFIGNREAAEVLRQSLAGMSAQQRGAIMQTLFGNDAMGAANALMQQGAEGYDAMSAAMLAQGGAADVAAIKNQGFNFAMESLKGSIETLQIVIGSALLPVLAGLVGQFTEGVNAVMNLVQAILDAGAGSIEFYEALGPLNAALGLAPGTLGAVYDAGMQVVTTLQGLATQAVALGQAFITWVTPYAQQLATAFQTQIVPAAMAVWTVFSTQIVPILQSLAPIVLALLEGALMVFASFWTNILVPAITAVWSFISANLLPILASLAAWLGETIPPLIQTVADFFANTLYPAINTIATYVSGTLLPALTNLASLGFVVVANKVSELWSKLTTALQPALDAMTSFIDEHAKPALENLAPVMSKAAEVAGAVAGGFDGIAKAIGAAIDKVKSFIDAASKIKVPSLVTPGSPTPLEIGLRGIADAAREAGGAVSMFLARGATQIGDSSTAPIETSIGKIGEAFAEVAPSLTAPSPVPSGLANLIAGLIAPTSAAPIGPGSSVTNNYNYAPTYSATPARPSADFAAMRSLAGAGV